MREDNAESSLNHLSERERNIEAAARALTELGAPASLEQNLIQGEIAKVFGRRRSTAGGIMADVVVRWRILWDEKQEQAD